MMGGSVGGELWTLFGFAVLIASDGGNDGLVQLFFFQVAPKSWWWCQRSRWGIWWWCC
jgi:hypothetical protein